MKKTARLSKNVWLKRLNLKAKYIIYIRQMSDMAFALFFAASRHVAR